MPHRNSFQFFQRKPFLYGTGWNERLVRVRQTHTLSKKKNFIKESKTGELRVIWKFYFHANNWHHTKILTFEEGEHCLTCMNLWKQFYFLASNCCWHHVTILNEHPSDIWRGWTLLNLYEFVKIFFIFLLIIAVGTTYRYKFWMNTHPTFEEGEHCLTCMNLWRNFYFHA